MHLAYKEPWQGGCPVPDFAFPLTPAGFQVHPAFLIFRSPWQTTELSRTASSFLSPLNIFPGPFFRPAKEWSNCVFFVFCFLFFFFWGGVLQNHCRWWLQPWNKKTLTPSKKSYDQPRQHIKKQRHYFNNKGPSSQSYGFSSSHVWIRVGL